MQIRLSTILLLTVVAAILFAWYSDRASSRQPSISGVWHYPSPLVSVLGYREVLTICEDGTFTKEQRHRRFSETYSGRYTVDTNGLVMFHVEKKVSGGKSKTASDLNIEFECACGFDSSGNLLIQPTHQLHLNNGELTDEFSEHPIEWRIYSPIPPEKQHEANIEKLKEIFDKAE